jgi:hypothetical protein
MLNNCSKKIVSKTKIADFIIQKVFSRFQILKERLKRAKTLKKNLKKSENKQTSIFFHLDAFTREGKLSFIKIAYFILIFLNLKSKPWHLC